MQGLRVLFQIWIIWKIVAVVLLKRNMTEKDVYRTHTFCYLDFNFIFLYGLFTTLMTPKGKKRINKALSKQCKQFLLLFYFGV